MVDPKGYYTIKNSFNQRHDRLTASMEDYLEMICRICQEEGGVRVNTLARLLHVRPSSASKMAGNLKDAGWINFEHYGLIVPTEAGWEQGKYLLYRHQVVFDFLCALNENDDQLAQTERIEHFLDRNTVNKLATLTKKIKKESFS